MLNRKYRDCTMLVIYKAGLITMELISAPKAHAYNLGVTFEQSLSFQSVLIKYQ